MLDKTSQRLLFLVRAALKPLTFRLGWRGVSKPPVLVDALLVSASDESVKTGHLEALRSAEFAAPCCIIGKLKGNVVAESVSRETSSSLSRLSM